eukprot:SAG31_NODE_1860_length_7048_cov_6.740325_1_plen_514_part_00
MTARALSPEVGRVCSEMAKEILRVGVCVDQPPHRNDTSAIAVCNVRCLCRVQPVASISDGEAGDAFATTQASTDLQALAANGRDEVVRIATEDSADSTGLATLLRGMQLLEVSRFHKPGTAEVLVLELIGWIEERPICDDTGMLVGTCYMERRKGLNDGVLSAGQSDHDVSTAMAGTEPACTPRPLAQIILWSRISWLTSAKHFTETRETGAEGLPLVVDEVEDSISGMLAAGLLPEEFSDWSYQLAVAFDRVVRLMRPGETAELHGVPAVVGDEENVKLDRDGKNWQASLRLLKAWNPKPAWEMNASEKLSEARNRRAQGNDCYKNRDWNRALTRYVLAAAAVAHADRDMNFDEEQRAEARVERGTVALNVAATTLQLGDGAEALRQCDEALACGQCIVKALWRRGKAHVLLGNGGAALADLRKAEKLAMSDDFNGDRKTSIQRQIRRERAKATALWNAKRQEETTRLAQLVPKFPPIKAAAALDGFGGIGTTEFLEDDPDLGDGHESTFCM